jgi:hypothetical protein
LVRRADILTTFMGRLYRNAGSLNLLKTKKPVQSCNAVALRMELLGRKGGPCVELTTLRPSCVGSLEILGASTWSPKDFSSTVMEWLYVWN